MKKVKKKKLKLLVVAMAESVHTAKWINQIADEGWDIHLFSYEHNGLAHESLRNITIYSSIYGEQKNKQKGVCFKGIYVFNGFMAKVVGRALRELFKEYRSRQLKRLIRKIKPDIIHSLETQKCGYLTIAAKDIIKGRFPIWIHSNWGSDLYLFGRLQKHEPRIRKVLEKCNYFLCENNRDIALAKHHGYKGKVLPISLHAGGFNVDFVSSLRQSGKISERRSIMLKGYQGWSGRGLVGLRALERCADLLSGYEILLYMVYSEDVLIKAELITKDTGIPIKIVEKGISDGEMLKLFGKSRISIGLGISDGVPNAMLEAIVMGSFPIQSWTSCAEDWIIDGKTGMLVPPEDPEIIEKSIRKALTDDDMVNSAAEKNYQLTVERLDEKIIRPKVIAMYRQIFDEINKQNE
jgi:glycosyltransferase involved in cell wall biosynthesis